MRNLIRSNGLIEADSVRLGDDAPRRAADFPELKSLFELRKTARAVPPTVCRKHTDQIAYYTCKDTGRPLCETCAAERKFGGTVRAGLRPLRGHRQRGSRTVLTPRASSAILRLPERE